MKNIMQQALGADWEQLPQGLKAHYRFGTSTDVGRMNIEYPRFMQIYLNLLRWFGALINRASQNVETVVKKTVVGERQYWRRKMTFHDGKVIYFNSFWISGGDKQLIEFVNPILGLQMAVDLHDGQLHYEGVRYVVKLGTVMLPIPEWLVLGHTSIVEVGIDDTHFSMAFCLTHPLLGEVFRYTGKFESMEIQLNA